MFAPVLVGKVVCFDIVIGQVKYTFCLFPKKRKINAPFYIKHSSANRVVMTN